MEKPIPVTSIVPSELPEAPKTDEKEDLKHLLSRISLTDGILTALLNISSSRRKAIYKLIILLMKYKRFDIESEVNRIEASLKAEKDF